MIEEAEFRDVEPARVITLPRVITEAEVQQIREMFAHCVPPAIGTDTGVDE